MRFDATGETGKPFPAPCVVIDAAGQILSPVLWCDTETGEVERYLHGADGFKLGPDFRALTVRQVRPAPLVLRSVAFS